MSNLTELNALRTAKGMKPLKAWKESKAKLDAVITKLSGASASKQLEASVKVIDKTKVSVKKVPAKKSAIEGVSISTIAAKLGIDPKVARAKLRRQDEVPCIEGSQWLFKTTDVSKIESILKGDARKKA